MREGLRYRKGTLAVGSSAGGAEQRTDTRNSPSSPWAERMACAPVPCCSQSLQQHTMKCRRGSGIGGRLEPADGRSRSCSNENAEPAISLRPAVCGQAKLSTQRRCRRRTVLAVPCPSKCPGNQCFIAASGQQARDVGRRSPGQHATHVACSRKATRKTRGPVYGT